MKSFNGLIFGSLLAALILQSGCGRVNDFFEREHALMPLKEQYFNGELDSREYRQKKKQLLEDMERAEARKKMEKRDAKIYHSEDSHTETMMEQDKMQAESSAEIMKEDDEIMAEAEPEMAPEPYVAPESYQVSPNITIDNAMLSRSIEQQKMGVTSSPAPVAPVQPVQPMQTAPVTSGGQEMISDSHDIRWKKDHDGAIIYEDKSVDELDKQVIQPGSTAN
ncbi:MAG: hypothetical protein AAFX93_06785 [Verrucomicrobiota bacterium]